MKEKNRGCSPMGVLYDNADVEKTKSLVTKRMQLKLMDESGRIIVQRLGLDDLKENRLTNKRR